MESGTGWLRRQRFPKHEVMKPEPNDCTRQPVDSGNGLFTPRVPFFPGPRIAAAVMTVLLAVLLSLIAWRITVRYQAPGKWNADRQGYCDFHNGVYYPALAFAQQYSPYGQNYAESFPVERPIPMYAPTVLLLHWPVALLDLRSAEILWYVVMAGLLLVIAWVSLGAAGWTRSWWIVAGLAAVLAGSRAGYGTLFTGYFTFELVVGTLLAVFAGQRTWVGGFGFALAAIKPTTGIPLAIMMLARGHWNSLLAGSALVLATSGIAIAWVMADGTSVSLLQQFQTSQEEHRADPNELPVNSWTRVDALAIVAKWNRWEPDDVQHLLVMFPLIAFPALAVWRNQRMRSGDFVGDRADLSATVSLLAVVVTLYHHHYDLVVLAPVGLAAAAGTCGWKRHPLARWILALLCFFPMVNYLTSNMVLEALQLFPLAEKIVTSLNGLALVAAFAMTTFLVWSENLDDPDAGNSQTDQSRRAGGTPNLSVPACSPNS